jgi:hypothetical protein
LTVSGSQKTNYVMFETPGTGSSRRYIAIVNVSGGFICWYQDVQDAVSSSRITGWSYTDDNTVLAVLNQGYLYEWDLDGSVLHSENLSADCQGGTGDEGPCPHHDAYRNPDNGRTYLTMGSIYDVVTPPVANPTYTGETGLDSFVEDGYRGFSSDWSSHSDYGTIADMSQDPNTYGGPRPECLTTYWTGTLDASYSPCDWTHANGISAMQVGSTVRVYLSLRNWDRIVAWDPVSETVKWELSGYDNSNVGDLALSLDSGVTGDANFYGQHHVTYHNGDLLMFDNRRNPETGASSDARAIQVEIDASEGVKTATIVKSWVMRTYTTHNAITTCGNGQGSAVVVPGSSGNNALVDCGIQALVQELDEPDGSTDYDPLFPMSPGGTIYRAYPLITVGEF